MLVEVNSESPLWRVVRPAFSKAIKEQVNEEQDHECAMCHHRVRWFGPHHIVPENALKNMGIKGGDVRANGVALCGPKNRGCHEFWDTKARNGVVYPGIPLDQVSEELFTRTRSGHKKTLQKMIVFKVLLPD